MSSTGVDFHRELDTFIVNEFSRPGDNQWAIPSPGSIEGDIYSDVERGASPVPTESTVESASRSGIWSSTREWEVDQPISYRNGRNRVHFRKIYVRSRNGYYLERSDLTFLRMKYERLSKSSTAVAAAAAETAFVVAIDPDVNLRKSFQGDTRGATISESKMFEDMWRWWLKPVDDAHTDWVAKVDIYDETTKTGLTEMEKAADIYRHQVDKFNAKVTCLKTKMLYTILDEKYPPDLQRGPLRRKPAKRSFEEPPLPEEDVLTRWNSVVDRIRALYADNPMIWYNIIVSSLLNLLSESTDSPGDVLKQTFLDHLNVNGTQSDLNIDVLLKMNEYQSLARSELIGKLGGKVSKSTTKQQIFAKLMKREFPNLGDRTITMDQPNVQCRLILLDSMLELSDLLVNPSVLPKPYRLLIPHVLWGNADIKRSGGTKRGDLSDNRQHRNLQIRGWSGLPFILKTFGARGVYAKIKFRGADSHVKKVNEAQIAYRFLEHKVKKENVFRGMHGTITRCLDHSLTLVPTICDMQLVDKKGTLGLGENFRILYSGRCITSYTNNGEGLAFKEIKDYVAETLSTSHERDTSSILYKITQLNSQLYTEDFPDYARYSEILDSQKRQRADLKAGKPEILVQYDKSTKIQGTGVGTLRPLYFVEMYMWPGPAPSGEGQVDAWNGRLEAVSNLIARENGVSGSRAASAPKDRRASPPFTGLTLLEMTEALEEGPRKEDEAFKNMLSTNTGSHTATPWTVMKYDELIVRNFRTKYEDESKERTIQATANAAATAEAAVGAAESAAEAAGVFATPRRPAFLRAGAAEPAATPAATPAADIPMSQEMVTRALTIQEISEESDDDDLMEAIRAAQGDAEEQPPHTETQKRVVQFVIKAPPQATAATPAAVLAVQVDCQLKFIVPRTTRKYGNPVFSLTIPMGEFRFSRDLIDDIEQKYRLFTYPINPSTTEQHALMLKTVFRRFRENFMEWRVAKTIIALNGSHLAINYTTAKRRREFINRILIRRFLYQADEESATINEMMRNLNRWSKGLSDHDYVYGLKYHSYGSIFYGKRRVEDAEDAEDAEEPNPSPRRTGVIGVIGKVFGRLVRRSAKVAPAREASETRDPGPPKALKSSEGSSGGSPRMSKKRLRDEDISPVYSFASPPNLTPSSPDLSPEETEFTTIMRRYCFVFNGSHILLQGNPAVTRTKLEETFWNSLATPGVRPESAPMNPIAFLAAMGIKCSRETALTEVHKRGFLPAMRQWNARLGPDPRKVAVVRACSQIEWIKAYAPLYYSYPDAFAPFRLDGEQGGFFTRLLKTLDVRGGLSKRSRGPGDPVEKFHARMERAKERLNQLRRRKLPREIRKRLVETDRFIEKLGDVDDEDAIREFDIQLRKSKFVNHVPMPPNLYTSITYLGQYLSRYEKPPQASVSILLEEFKHASTLETKVDAWDRLSRTAFKWYDLSSEFAILRGTMVDHRFDELNALASFVRDGGRTDHPTYMLCVIDLDPFLNLDGTTVTSVRRPVDRRSRPESRLVDLDIATFMRGLGVSIETIVSKRIHELNGCPRIVCRTTDGFKGDTEMPMVNWMCHKTWDLYTHTGDEGEYVTWRALEDWEVDGAAALHPFAQVFYVMDSLSFLFMEYGEQMCASDIVFMEKGHPCVSWIHANTFEHLFERLDEVNAILAEDGKMSCDQKFANTLIMNKGHRVVAANEFIRFVYDQLSTLTRRQQNARRDFSIRCWDTIAKFIVQRTIRGSSTYKGALNKYGDVFDWVDGEWKNQNRRWAGSEKGEIVDETVLHFRQLRF